MILRCQEFLATLGITSEELSGFLKENILAITNSTNQQVDI